MVQESLALDFYAGCYATALSAWRLLQGPVLSRDYPKAVRSGTLGSRQQAARQGGEQRAPERLDQRRAACRRSDATSSDRRAPGLLGGLRANCLTVSSSAHPGVGSGPAWEVALCVTTLSTRSNCQDLWIKIF